MNLPINFSKRKTIRNLFTKLTKLCHLLLKKFFRILDGLNGMKKFTMKINGTYTGKILGKKYFKIIIFLIDRPLGNLKDQKLIKNFCIFQKQALSAQKTAWQD